MIPPKVKSFIERAGPEKEPMPLDEMFNKFREESRGKDKAFLMPVRNPQGIDQIAELRIREWMLRMKSGEEKTEAAKKPARIRNKIPPPKI